MTAARSRVRSNGVEASAAVTLPSGFSAHGQITHDDAVDGQTGKPLVKVPHDVGAASLGWRSGKITADFGLRAQAATPDVSGTIQAFTVLYLAGVYALTPGLGLTARVENLGDVHYQQAFGYGEPGRMVMIGLRWTD
jgi:vitamin B12 transporter